MGWQAGGCRGGQGHPGTAGAPSGWGPSTCSAASAQLRLLVTGGSAQRPLPAGLGQRGQNSLGRGTKGQQGTPVVRETHS